MSNQRNLGFWILMIFGLLILAMLFAGQMMSIIDYEFTVSIGLQESADVIGDMGVATNKGFGVGDTFIYIPLMVMGLLGLWLRKPWGLLPMAAALGITAYWPVVNMLFLFYAKGIPGFHFTDFTSYTIILSIITLYGIWGIWYLHKNQKLLVNG